jgi:hypothetical protein
MRRRDGPTQGGRVEVASHTRLFELGQLVPAAPVPGRLRSATVDDVDLAVEWFGAFMADADEQAGRVAGVSAHETPTADDMLRRIEGGRVWFWLDEDGDRVHLTAANRPASARPGSVRCTRRGTRAGVGTRVPRSPKCRG